MDETRIRALAVLPARGGSKGILKKNLQIVAGKPLLAWTVEAALGATHVDKVIISSDDDEIISIGKQYGCEAPFKRPANLSTDESGSVEVLLHAMKFYPSYDYVIFLQPTSPLRTSSDINFAFKLFLDTQAASCVSITDVNESPFWMFERNKEGFINQLIKSDNIYTRRQDLPIFFKPNGAIYIVKSRIFKMQKSFLCPPTVGYVMPRERSIDIDTQYDLDRCNHYLSQALKLHE